MKASIRSLKIVLIDCYSWHMAKHETKEDNDLQIHNFYQLLKMWVKYENSCKENLMKS